MSVSVPWSAVGLPDAVLLVDDVLVVVVDVEQLLAAAEQLRVVNVDDLRRWFQISFLHNCYLLFVLFDDYLEFRSSSIKHERGGSLRSKSFKILFKIFWLAPLLVRFSYRFLSDFEAVRPTGWVAALKINRKLIQKIIRACAGA